MEPGLALVLPWAALRLTKQPPAPGHRPQAGRPGRPPAGSAPAGTVSVDTVTMKGTARGQELLTCPLPVRPSPMPGLDIPLGLAGTKVAAPTAARPAD